MVKHPGGAEALGDQAHRYLADDTLKRCPYAMLAQMRELAPIVRAAGGQWLVLDYELGRAVLRDGRLSRSQAAQATLSAFLDPGPAADIWTAKLVSSDGERHRRLRGTIAKGFTNAAVAAWRPTAETHANSLIDDAVARGEMDAVADFAYPLTEHVICSLLGVPFEDHLRFESWTATIQNRGVTGAGAAQARAEAARAILEFTEYLAGVVDDHAPAGDGDLIARLACAQEDQGPRLSREELVVVAMEMVIGGHDTTANLIVNGIFELARSPELRQAVACGDVPLPNLVEELLRARSPVQLSHGRVANERLELAGQVIEEGDIVMVSLAGANRDEAAFPGGDSFDPTREPGRHLGFGNGQHYCVGAHLARMEAQVALGAVARRLPGLHVTVDEAVLPWREGSLVIAPSRLPVAW
jgi:cytochrome P450